MSSSLTTAEVDLVGRVNFGVNSLIRWEPGLHINKTPSRTLAEKAGTSGDIATLKAFLLRKEGIPIERIAVGFDRRERESFALLKSEWKGWMGRKRPCWLVLERDDCRVSPLHRSRYACNKVEIKTLPAVFFELGNGSYPGL